MPLLPRKMKRSKLVLVALAASISAGLLAPASPVSADPKFADALVGAGSDTTMDVMAALSGFANGKPFTPVQSTSVSGSKLIASWDSKLASQTDNCIAAKLKAPTTYRPNGSSEGRRALSRAIDGTVYGPVAECGGSKVVTGLFDFARSSSGPSSGDTGTALTYVPFGRDALAVAYYANGVATPVTDFTRAQITSLYTTGPQTINGVEVVPCGIQLGSGTYASWLLMTAATAVQDASSTAICEAAGATTGRIQENDATALKMKGDGLVGKQVIIGFSAANFIAQGNGVALSQLAAGVDLGTISNDGTGANLGVAYTTSGTAPVLYTAAPTFYASTVFGRNVYNVFDTARVTGFGNADVKSLFVGPTSAVCSTDGQITVNKFGFSTIGTCGAITLTGSLITGIK